MCINRALHVEGNPADQTQGNARLIAATRNHIRELCEEVLRLRVSESKLTKRPKLRTHFTDDGQVVMAWWDRVEEK